MTENEKQPIPNFVDILDNVFRDDKKQKDERYRTYSYRHNPSSASVKLGGKIEGKCLRQLYYRATKEPESEPFEPGDMYSMFLGDAIHGAIAKKLQKSREISFMPEVGGKVLVDGLTKEISYRVDGIVSCNGEIGGLEVKTTQGEALTSKYYGIKLKGPKVDHLLQVICYFNSFPGLKWFVLYYIARDNGYKLQFNVERSGDEYKVTSLDNTDFSHLIKGVKFEDITSRWSELETAIKDKQLPKRDFKVWLKSDGTIQDTKTIAGKLHKTSWQCNYCPFKTKCWSEPDAREAAYDENSFRQPNKDIGAQLS